MALKIVKNFNPLKAGALLVVLASLLLNPVSALANGSAETNLPAFADFVKAVQNGEANVLRGVYIQDVLALPVVQQPAGNAGYVSYNKGEITQFGMAAQYGTIGLLAHNYLSGRHFSQLKAGQEVRLVYGDRRIETFIVTEVLRYQALQPTSPYSSFRSLDKEQTLTAEGMFKRVYFSDGQVTFQTCIEAEGDLSWGRLFVIAVPKSEASAFGRQQQQAPR
jgi:hypothetical protein